MIAQELEICLHSAFVEARQDRHEAITVEHLLLALLGAPTATQALRASGASPEALRKLLADHVAKHARRAAPGQDVDTQPTLGFQRVIQRAILQVQSSGKKEVTSADVLTAILGEKDSYAAVLLEQHSRTSPKVIGDQPSQDPMAAPRLGGGALERELEAGVDVAFAAARQDRHEFFTVEHLLLALLDNPSAARMLRGCGVRVHALRKTLARHITEQTPRVGTGHEADTQPTLGVQRLMLEATHRMQRVGKKEVTGADALVAIFDDKNSFASRLLAEHGITRYDAVFYLTHGVAPASASYEADLPDGAELQVVLYNDDYTPMQFVVDVLQKFFSMTQTDAAEAMLEVHRKGVGVCGLFARDEAVELMKTVLDYARQHGHPLNCGVLASKLP